MIFKNDNLKEIISHSKKELKELEKVSDNIIDKMNNVLLNLQKLNLEQLREKNLELDKDFNKIFQIAGDLKSAKRLQNLKNDFLSKIYYKIDENSAEARKKRIENDTEIIRVHFNNEIKKKKISDIIYKGNIERFEKMAEKILDPVYKKMGTLEDLEKRHLELVTEISKLNTNQYYREIKKFITNIMREHGKKWNMKEIFLKFYWMNLVITLITSGIITIILNIIFDKF